MKNKVKFTCVEVEKERDIDIILEKNGISTAIPYAEEYTDRDTTLKAYRNMYLQSIKSVGLWVLLAVILLHFVFVLLPSGKQLEEEFGAEKVAYHFAPIKEDSVMFQMGMDEVFDLMKQRGES